MVSPFGAVAGTLAVICSNHRGGYNKSFNSKWYEERQKEAQKNEILLEYCTKTFEVQKVEVRSIVFDSYEYILSFDSFFVGISISSSMLREMETEHLCDYAYHLVLGELVNHTKKIYVKEKKQDGVMD